MRPEPAVRSALQLAINAPDRATVLTNNISGTPRSAKKRVGMTRLLTDSQLREHLAAQRVVLVGQLPARYDLAVPVGL